MTSDCVPLPQINFQSMKCLFFLSIIVSREPAFQLQANMFWFLKILNDMRTTAGFAQCQQLPTKQKCRKTKDLGLAVSNANK